jgi:hypothetical protein
MDWEKQDNELRVLMDGAGFLPEGETWDAEEGWKKMQQKGQPAHGKKSPVWLRLAAAACFAGLVGSGFWYVQKNDSNARTDKESVKRSVSQPALTGKNLGELKTEPEYQQVPDSSKQINETAQKASVAENTVIANHGEVKVSIRKDFKGGSNLTEIKPENNNIDEALVINETDKKSETEIALTEQTLQTETIPQAIAVVTAPVKKNKPRVIHYNQLSGKQTTSPPLFVQTKKPYPEWDGFAMQSVSNPKESPFQLKIDISPAPKKSL